MNTGCQTFLTIIKTDTTYFLKIKKKKNNIEAVSQGEKTQGPRKVPHAFPAWLLETETTFSKLTDFVSKKMYLSAVNCDICQSLAWMN